MACKWKDRIAERFPSARIDKWDEDHAIAAVTDWKTGREYLWIGGNAADYSRDQLCTMTDGAMQPREILYNLSYLSPSERKEAIEGIKSMAEIVQLERQRGGRIDG